MSVRLSPPEVTTDATRSSFVAPPGRLSGGRPRTSLLVRGRRLHSRRAARLAMVEEDPFSLKSAPDRFSVAQGCRAYAPVVHQDAVRPVDAMADEHVIEHAGVCVGPAARSRYITVGGPAADGDARDDGRELDGIDRHGCR